MGFFLLCFVRPGLPICAHSISLSAPMKCGVALMSLEREMESIVWPTLYQRADLRACSFSAASWRGAICVLDTGYDVAKRL